MDCKLAKNFIRTLQPQIFKKIIYPKEPTALFLEIYSEIISYLLYLVLLAVFHHSEKMRHNKVSDNEESTDHQKFVRGDSSAIKDVQVHGLT